MPDALTIMSGLQTPSVRPGPCVPASIYTPDFYTLLNNVLANPSYYGLSNVLSGGFSIDAIDNLFPTIPPLNGPANNYIFWDPQDPTAKFHAVIADVAQQIVSPVQISKLAVFIGSNRLDVVNMPLGLSGFVEGCTNLSVGGWTSVTNFNSTSLNQSIFVMHRRFPPARPAPRCKRRRRTGLPGWWDRNKQCSA